MKTTEIFTRIIEGNQRALSFLSAKKTDSEKKYRQMIELVASQNRQLDETLHNRLNDTSKNTDYGDQVLSLETTVLLQILGERITLLNSVLSKKHIQPLLLNQQSINLADLVLDQNASDEVIVVQLEVLNRLIPVISSYLKQKEEKYFNDRANYDTYSLACFSLAFGACLLGAGAFGLMVLTGAPVLFPTLVALAIFASCAALIGSGFNAASFLVAIKLNAFSQDSDIQKFVKLDDCRTDMKQQLFEVETPIINSVLNQSNEKVQFESHDKLSSYGFDKYSTLFRPISSIKNEDLPLKKVSEIIEERCLARL